MEWRQTVCKPGSVPRERGDGHSSGTFVAERLARPTRAAARQARPAAPVIGQRRLPLLLGLAPGGVCRAAAVAGSAVRSYRTISPLPPPGRTEMRKEGSAVYFLWHFPWGHPRRALPGTAPAWSPDFPHRANRAARPSDRLAWDHVGSPAPLVKVPRSGESLRASRTKAMKRRSAGPVSLRRLARLSDASKPAWRWSG